MTGKSPRRPTRAPVRGRGAPAPIAQSAVDAPPMTDDAQPWKKRRAPRHPAGARRRDDAEAIARAKADKPATAELQGKTPSIAMSAPKDPAVAAAIQDLRAAADPSRADAMAAYHKTGRLCLGVANPDIDAAAKAWRAAMAEGPDPLAARLSLAAGLWDAGGFETRIAAAKLLTQARIPGDAPVWDLITSWAPQFDGWAIADAVAGAGSRRVAADPSRLDALETWTASPRMLTRRAALVFTLPFAKTRHGDAAARERILGWAAGYAADRDWFIQKAIGWWLRSLSVHDPERVRAFIAAHGDAMKPFARKEALRLID